MILRRRPFFSAASFLLLVLFAKGLYAQDLNSSPEYSAGMDSYMNGQYEEAKQYWLSAAQSGNSKAMFNLGLLHERAQISDADPIRANQWFEQAGNAGYPAADYHLALRLRESGQYAKSVRLLERSAAAGFVLAKDLVSSGSEETASSLTRQQSAPTSIATPKTEVPKTVAPKVADTNTQQVTRSGRNYHREDWLLKQAPDFWTIQMLAFSDEAKVRNFIDDHKLHSNAAYFSEGLDGRAVYKLVYGAYASKERADQARSGLSSELKKHGPWLREIKAVQQIIREQK